MKNANLLQLFIYCLLKANHQENEFIFGGDLMKIKRGEFISGRFEIAKALNMNPSSVYKNLKKLQLLGYISLNSNNKNTLITIVKYDSYQSTVTTKEQQSNNKVTTKEQQSNTSKNDKNEYNEKSEEQTAPEISEPPSPPKNNYNIIPPKMEWVKERFLELKYKDDSEMFFNFYESKGWKIGKDKMKNWSSTIVTWNARSKEFNSNGQPVEINPGWKKAVDHK